MASERKKLTRRDLGKTALAAAGAMVTASSLEGAPVLARRPLGRTGLDVSVLGLGCAPLGDRSLKQQEVDRVIDAAQAAHINYLDTAPNYRMSERNLGRALRGRRDQFILVSKVETTSRQDAIWQVEESLYKLQTDYLDLVHLHNVGRTDRFPSLEVLTGDDGALGGLRELKKKGIVRHIGLTSHLRTRRALPILEKNDDIEVVMCTVNFVDHHTYNFEETVLAEAARRGLGIVAMKVLGGKLGHAARLSGVEHYQDAVRYALGLPSLSVAIMGIKNVPELEQAVQTVLAYQPLQPGELSRILKRGKEMAQEWGELRGPASLSA